MIKMTMSELGERVRQLRLAAGLTQSDVAEKLSLPRQSIGQIESGERDISSIELAHIAELFSVTADSLLKKENIKPLSKYSGKIDINFNGEKLRNLLLYVLSKCGGKPNIGETVLYKLLYFIDFDSFELRSDSITGLQYVKLQFGPVPLARQYLPAIKNMSKNGDLRIIKQVYGGMAQKKYVALTDPDLSVFLPEELRIIDMVIDRLSDMNASQITFFVHEDIPWKESADEGVIDYRLVFERTVPFACSDRTAMWQDAAGADAIKNLGHLPKAEYDYYEKL